MELFIPSIVVLLFAALVCFFVLPNMSPYVLGILSLLMFGIGIWQHYSMFPYEYRTPSMVTDMMREYAGFIMLIVVIIIGIGMILNSYGLNPPAVTEILPQAITAPFTPASNSKSIFNLGGNSANSGITGAINQVSSGFTGALNNASKSVTNLMKPGNSKSNSLVSPSFKVS
jgi:hypothetical protein